MFALYLSSEVLGEVRSLNVSRCPQAKIQNKKRRPRVQKFFLVRSRSRRQARESERDRDLQPGRLGARSQRDLFSELALCHDHIYAADRNRWLDFHGTHRIRGRERVSLLGQRLFPEVPLRWMLGQKFKANPETSSLAGRVDFRSRHATVNIPWFTAYLLLVTVEGKASKDRDPARRAKERPARSAGRDGRWQQRMRGHRARSVHRRRRPVHDVI